MRAALTSRRLFKRGEAPASGPGGIKIRNRCGTTRSIVITPTILPHVIIRFSAVVRRPPETCAREALGVTGRRMGSELDDLRAQGPKNGSTRVNK